jgi:hypothetical protein
MIKYLSIHMAKNILRKQFGPMYGKDKPYAIAESIPNKVNPSELMKIGQPTIGFTTVILITLLVFLVLFLYFNRNYIYSLFQRIYKDFQPSDKIDQLEQKYHELSQNDSKLLVEIAKSEKAALDSIEQRLGSIEQKEKNQKEQEKKEESGGIQKIQNNINRYSDEQTVKKNGFCYIGYDKNQRECTNVYEGDICMSGQIFPTMAVCLNPHLRP